MALSGCSKPTINIKQVCDIDDRLVVKIKECQRPTHKVINGDAVECIRKLRIDIMQDNPRKEELLKQIHLCKNAPQNLATPTK